MSEILYSREEGSALRAWTDDFYDVGEEEIKEYLNWIYEKLGGRSAFRCIKYARVHPGRGIAIHAVVFPDGRTWDLINGWREYDIVYPNGHHRVVRAHSIPLPNYEEAAMSNHLPMHVKHFNNPLAALRSVLPDVYGRIENELWHFSDRAEKNLSKHRTRKAMPTTLHKIMTESKGEVIDREVSPGWEEKEGVEPTKKIFCNCNDSWDRATCFDIDAIECVPDTCPKCGYVLWTYVNKEDEPEE